MLLFVGGELLLSLSCSSEAVESESEASFSSLPLLSQLFSGAQREDGADFGCDDVGASSLSIVSISITN